MTRWWEDRTSRVDNDGSTTARRRRPEHGRFAGEFLRHPMRAGAVMATATDCVAGFLDEVPLAGARTVVELGAGSGAITAELAGRLPDSSRLLAVEVSPALTAQLRTRCPEVDVACASAFDLPDLVRARGLLPVDLIVCSVPWTVMGEQRDRFLGAARETLADGGTFSTLLVAHRARERGVAATWVGRHFSDVKAGRVLWGNLPPLRALHSSTRRHDGNRTPVR
ncbi:MULTISPECIES: class I SAM-dependent methyltransferase [Prauserella salsuginis group]|uniref:Phospholipid N-methyltransferase n=2 Tax=Prauserella salsuginis group TaxID=2893672 RepID=A0A839XZ29_9PSEU|nr:MULTISPECIES: methyltransferase domain-containing protein [Prauserella salsuginis group]MBB3665286.1 phospholipid N-methyltransferase [Prauserella sediminis]